jgi:hypothetical protein
MNRFKAIFKPSIRVRLFFGSHNKIKEVFLDHSISPRYICYNRFTCGWTEKINERNSSFYCMMLMQLQVADNKWHGLTCTVRCSPLKTPIVNSVPPKMTKNRFLPNIAFFRNHPYLIFNLGF